MVSTTDVYTDPKTARESWAEPPLPPAPQPPLPDPAPPVPPPEPPPPRAIRLEERTDFPISVTHVASRTTAVVRRQAALHELATVIRPLARARS